MLQETALKVLKSGKNIFLTGSAGAGKTYVLNQYIDYLQERGVGTAITASTGIAATHINGQTIHSWSGVGIKDIITEKDLEKIAKKKPLREKIEKARVLIIDEISMLSGNTLNNIDIILQFIKIDTSPFGGMQVIFCGDFFQLPPVSRSGEPNFKKFAFMSTSWVSAQLSICYLTEQHRQGDDKLSNLLNEIRSGEVCESTGEMLRENMERATEKTDYKGIKLFTHNADVDAINQKEIEKLESAEEIYFAEEEGNAQLVDSLRKSVLAVEELVLKDGAQVMFVKNNYEMGYLNGTMGTVIGFDNEGFPIVMTTEDKVITAKTTDWSVYNEYGQVVASYKQIPLRLAWAITVHKSQGMTLDEAEINLSKTFEPGQGYVALSRVRSWDGLYLTGCNHSALVLDPLAMKADARFQELSEEIEEVYVRQTEEQLNTIFDQKIKSWGGSTDPAMMEINRAKKGQKLKKLPKVSTYDQTKKLVEGGKSIAEIAEARQMSQDTIVSHLTKLRKDHPDLAMDQCRPAPEIMEEVELALQVLHEIDEPEDKDAQGNIKLKVLYEQLEGEMTYEDIKRAVIFIDR